MSAYTRSTESSGPVAANPPPCFGDEQRVCPKDSEGFFQPQSNCAGCQWVQRCLRTALEKMGLMRMAAPPSSSEDDVDCGLVRFFKRWSEKKRRASHGEAD